MSRLARAMLLLTIFGAALAAVSAPSQAAGVKITISASRTVLDLGGKTTFRGEAKKAKPGSVLKLQRRHGGTWRTVVKTKIDRSRNYAFTVRPPRGELRYRVLKPAQLGQARAVSRDYYLQVRWRPTLEVTTEPTTFAGTPYLSISGTVHQASTEAAYVYIETRSQAGTWSPVGGVNELVDENDPHFAFPTRLPPGTVFRVKLQSTELTRAIASDPASFPELPYSLMVNSGVTVDLLESGEDAAQVLINLVAGQELGLAVDPGGQTGSWKLRFVGPDGTELGHLANGTASARHFTVPTSGGYRLIVDSAVLRAFEIWATTPLVRATEVDVTLPETSVLPGQGLDISFPVTAGQAVTFDQSSNLFWKAGDSVVDSSGSDVEPLLPARGNAPGGQLGHSPVFLATEADTWTFRSRPPTFNALKDDFVVRNAPVYEIGLDAPAVDFVVDDPGEVALFRFDPIEGLWPPTFNSFAFDDLTVTEGDPVAQWDGDDVFAVAGQSFSTHSMSLLSPVHTNWSLGDPLDVFDATGLWSRYFVQHVPLQAGDVVTTVSNEPTTTWDMHGPDLVRLPRLEGRQRAWVIPTDGTYFHSRRWFHPSTTLDAFTMGLMKAKEIAFPQDGSPTVFSVDVVDQAVIARGTAAPGSTVTLEFVSADAGLDFLWSATISQPGSNGKAIWPDFPDPQQITVGESGTYLVHVTLGDDMTGDVTLRQTVIPPSD